VKERLALAIVGNGPAAAEAVLALRASGYASAIHLFADNHHPPYNPMLGTYLVAGAIPLERAFPFGDQRSFYEGNGVTAHLGSAIVHLDAEEQVLTTAQGQEYHYDRCLVATGARPAVPPIPGLREAVAPSADTNSIGRHVFTIQDLAGVLALKQRVDELRQAAVQEGAGGGPAPHAAVIGASFAGIKIAAVLHDLGLRVTLIEREPHILPLAALPECARLLEEHLLREGYELRLGAALSRLSTDATTEAGRPGVRLDFGALPGAADPSGADGTACEESTAQQVVDLVVVCTGTRPALSFLVPGQVDTGVGILVDEVMRSSRPTLFAAGDVAQGKNLLSGRHEIIGLWSSARLQGRAAGRSLAGIPERYRGGVPHNITHVGRRLFAAVGCVDDYDEVEVTHKNGSHEFRVRKEGRLVGVNLLDCCLSAGVVKQALLRAATGATTEREATWISFSG
jgi:NADPH-dependent 2,4-dienoyl-CoA reductase/sulfur reductase-like enzyme